MEKAGDLFEIFSGALEHREDAIREAYLKEACGNDTDLEREVRELLRSHAATSGSFSRPFATLPELAQERSEDFVSDPWLDLPTPFGDRYVLEEVIGKGGMGVIYRATQTKLNRVVALKMIRNSQLATRNEVKRFYAEAQAAARLDHPGVVPVIETGKVGDQHFFSMGYVEGITLAEAVKGDALNRAQCLVIARGLASALAYTHGEGVIHRDLKPGNILLSLTTEDPQDPDHFQPRISDFGLAKTQHTQTDLTVAGEIFGTPAYMSPEQASGMNEDISAATDIYSFGAVLYFMLTGRPPFEGLSVWAVLNQVESTDPAPPSQIKPGIPADLETICLKCLRKQVQNRYPDAATLLRDVDNFLENRPLLARRASVWNRFHKYCHRHPTTVVAVVLGTLLALSLILLPGGKEPRAGTGKTLSEAPRTTLGRAFQLETTGQSTEALRTFSAAIRLAEEADDPRTATLARYGLDALRQDFWQACARFSLPSTGSVQTLQLSPDGEAIALATTSGQLRVIDRDTRERRLDVTLPSPALALAFQGDQDFLLAACQDGIVRFWKRQDRSYLPHSELSLRLDGSLTSAPKIVFLSFDQEEKVLHLLTGRGQLTFWDFAKRRLLSTRNLPAPLASASVNSAQNLLWLFQENGKVWALDATTGKLRLPPRETGLTLLGGSALPDNSGLLLHPQDEPPQLLLLLNSGGVPTLGPPRRLFSLTNSRRILSGGVPSRLVALSDNQEIRFWSPDPAGGNLPSLRFQNSLPQFALSGNGRTLATVHPDAETLILWQPPLRWRNSFPLASTPVQAASMQTPVLSLGNKSLNIYAAPRDLPRPFPRKQSLPLDRPQSASFITPEGIAYLTFGGLQPQLQALNLNTGETLWTLPQPHDGPLQICLHPDQRHLALIETGVWGLQQPNLTIVDLQRASLSHFTVPARTLHAGVFSTLASDTLLLSSERSGLVWYNWKKEEVIRQRELTDPLNLVTVLAASPESGRIATGTADRAVTVYDEKSWTALSPPVRHYTRVAFIRFARKGDLVLSADGSPSARLWDALSGLSLGRPLRHDSPLAHLTIDEASDRILTGTNTGTLTLWPLPRKISQKNLEMNLPFLSP